MKLSSTAFLQGASIPKKYGCKGENINPPLVIEGVPKEAKSLALIMDDPDVPEFVRKDRLWVHWVLYNIDPETTLIEENCGVVGILGKNTDNKNAYMGPCPPDREHRYYFKLYALDITLSLGSGATKAELLADMADHILEETELMGRYSKQL